jgi:hypothetical protein
MRTTLSMKKLARGDLARHERVGIWMTLVRRKRTTMMRRLLVQYVGPPECLLELDTDDPLGPRGIYHR